MSQRQVDSQPAYVLHSRPFRDSSLIVDLLTADYCRVGVVVKGVKGTGKTAKQRRALVQPFVPLLAGWTGRSELKTLVAIEAYGAPAGLQGRRLFSGLYANELLNRLLPKLDIHCQVYSLYQWLLKTLQTDDDIEITLRRFELQLLQELGYGVDFESEAESGESIVAEQVYRFDPQRGFITLTNDATNSNPANQYSGKVIRAIAAGEFDDANRPYAKRLCRQALAVHLGDKPLKSRELFMQGEPAAKNKM